MFIRNVWFKLPLLNFLHYCLWMHLCKIMLLQKKKLSKSNTQSAPLFNKLRILDIYDTNLLLTYIFVYSTLYRRPSETPHPQTILTPSQILLNKCKATEQYFLLVTALCHKQVGPTFRHDKRTFRSEVSACTPPTYLPSCACFFFLQCFPV